MRRTRVCCETCSAVVLPVLCVLELLYRGYCQPFGTTERGVVGKGCV